MSRSFLRSSGGRRRRLVAGIVAMATATVLGGLGVLAVPATAATEGSGATLRSSDLTGDMVSALTGTASSSRYLGTTLSGLVIDADDGSAVWRFRDGTARLPASTEKLLTAYTVLHSLDAAGTLTTSVRQSPTEPYRVYLRGGGDPSLSLARIRALASATAQALTRQGRSAALLYVDGSALPAPTMPAGWTKDSLSDGQLPQGLTLAGYRKADGALAAGRALVAALKPLGINATLRGTATTPSGATTLATTSSPTIGAMVATMLNASVNDYAEFLLRHAAIAAGRRGTAAGAAAYEVALLKRAGVPMGGLRVADGNGLSRADRMPVATLAAVIRALWADPADQAIVFGWSGLPRAGQSGTLAARFRSSAQSCAQGQVLAKTGTLKDAVTLAGLAHGVDGRDRIFVFLENGRTTHSASVRTAIDTLATDVVGCTLG